MAATFQPKFDTLISIFEESTKRYRDRRLFGTKQAGTWVWSTYGEFEARVHESRGGFAAIGVGAGDRVGIIANNRPEWAIGAYAAYGRKAAFVPMYESTLPKEWSYVLKDCGAKAVIVANVTIRDAIFAAKTADEGLPDLTHIIVLDGDGGGERNGVRGLSWREFLDLGKQKPAPIERPTGEDIACFIYTSGTTGKSKGVLLTHSNFASNVSAMHEVFPMDPEDRSLSFLPWAHSFGQTVELHMLISNGASMGICEGVSKILDNLQEVQPTLLFSVPQVFNRLYDGVNKQIQNSPPWRRRLFESAVANAAYRKKLAEQRRTSGFADFKHGLFDRVVFSKVRGRFGGKLRYAFSGGAAISREVAEFIDNLGIIVYEGYGLTETSPIATANWPGARKIGSVGQAIPGVEVKIDLKATDDPKSGEIVVYGHNVMKGYHNLEEENKKVFTEDGGFRTGDMGYLDEDGFLYITGRIKEQYKLENGKYVAPAPLEEYLKLSPFISHCMICGANKPFNVALIVANMAEVKAFAEKEGIREEGNALLENEKVQARFRSEIDQYSAEFKQFEKIKKFQLISEEFSIENGMLTPKMSLKRKEVLKRWGDAIDVLYAG